MTVAFGIAKELDITFYQHLQPALRTVPAGLLFLLRSIPLGFSASAYVLLYTVARSNTHLNRPPVLSSPLEDRMGVLTVPAALAELSSLGLPW